MPRKPPFARFSKHGALTPQQYEARYRHHLLGPYYRRPPEPTLVPPPGAPPGTPSAHGVFWQKSKDKIEYEEFLPEADKDPVHARLRHGPFEAEDVAMANATTYIENEAYIGTEHMMQSIINAHGLGPSSVPVTADLRQATASNALALGAARKFAQSLIFPEGRAHLAALNAVAAAHNRSWAEHDRAALAARSPHGTPSTMPTHSPVHGVSRAQYQALLAAPLPQRDKFLLLIPMRERELLRAHINLDLRARHHHAEAAE